MFIVTILVEQTKILNRYQVGKFYLKKYSDDRITANWGLWDNLFNYDNALRAAQKRGVTLIQNISDEDSHLKLGDMDIQLYNYKNEYDADGNLKKFEMITPTPLFQ